MSANAAPMDGPEPSTGTIVEVFEEHSERGLSTADVVAALPYNRETVYEKLLQLAGEGVLDRNRVPGWETIWWITDAPDGLEGNGLR